MTEEPWETMARVAKGLQLDDPINWPHYADEAARLVEERDRYREALEHIVEPNVHDRIETARRALSAASGDPVARETTPPTAELEQGS